MGVSAKSLRGLDTIFIDDAQCSKPVVLRAVIPVIVDVYKRNYNKRRSDARLTMRN